MSTYQRILGLPFVYNRVRPLLLGGIDTSPVYTCLDVRPSDTVLDVGCGTGVALSYLGEFARYVGFDTDEIALAHARSRAKRDPRRVDLVGRVVRADDVEEIAPDVAVLSGLLHHLTDGECADLFAALKHSVNLRRVTTLDVAFFPGQVLNNVLSVLDRGQYARRPEDYLRLAREAGYRVEDAFKSPSRPGGKRINYWVMSLAP